MKEKFKHAPLWKYRNISNGDKHTFPKVIQAFNAKLGYDLTIEQAEEIFRMLRVASDRPRREGRYEEQYIVCYSRTGHSTPDTWKGLWSQKMGEVRQGNEGNGYRGKFNRITVRPKGEVILAIKRIEKCDRARADQIFESCRRNHILVPVRHAGVVLWHGCEESPLPEDVSRIAKKRPAPTKAQYYIDRYGMAPPLPKHNYVQPELCGQIQWIIKREAELGNVIGVDKGVAIRKRILGVHRDPAKLSRVKDRRTGGMIGILSAARNPFRAMPKMTLGSEKFVEWSKLMSHPTIPIETSFGQKL